MAASIDPEMSALMLALLAAGGSDLHISANSAAYIRINGDLQPLTENSFSSGEIKRLIYSLLSSEQQQQFEKNYELDCAYELKNGSRFRLNVYKEKITLPPACDPLAIKYQVLNNSACHNRCLKSSIAPMAWC